MPGKQRTCPARLGSAPALASVSAGQSMLDQFLPGGVQEASDLDKVIAEARRELRRLSDGLDAAAGLPSDGVFA